MPDRPRLVVLDTNVVVSGFLSPAGPPAQILGLTLAGKLTPAHDARILAELSEVLRRPEFSFSMQHIEAVLIGTRLQEWGKALIHHLSAVLRLGL